MTRPRPFLSAHPAANSVIFGAPEDFDFLAALREATSIRCAIAFGHMSGWKKIEAAIKASKAKSVCILLGQAFLQTEPDLLDLLRRRQEKASWLQGRLAPTRSTFHPKVWIIETLAKTHMIVGSANLSGGGFVSNNECSAYLTGEDTAAEIKEWFNQSWKGSAPLNAQFCDDYREQYDQLKKSREGLRKATREAEEKLQMRQNQFRRDEAVKAAKLYFGSTNGRSAAKAREAAMKRIANCLHPSTNFDFSKEEWLNFLAVPEFGSLKRIPRKTANDLVAIRKAFRHLADNSIPLSNRYNNVVPSDGRFHVHSVGQNIATKILAMLYPDTMPVYNNRVEKTLVAFGYSFERAQSEGDSYAEFCRQVKDFTGRCGQKNVLSIDAFFEDYSRTLR